MKYHQGGIVYQHPLSLFPSALFSLSCQRLSSHSLFFYLPLFSFSYSSFSPLAARWLKPLFPLFHSPLTIVLSVFPLLFFWFASSLPLFFHLFCNRLLFRLSSFPSHSLSFPQSLSHYHPSILLLSSLLLCFFYIPLLPYLPSFLFFP